MLKKQRIMSLKKHLYCLYLVVFAALSWAGCTSPETTAMPTLKDAYAGKFRIGTAMNTDQITGTDAASVAVIKEHFNSIVAENCMKSEILQPREGKFDFTLSDQFVEFGTANQQFIVGHTLVWHSQTPSWFFVGEDGRDVSREELIARMKHHITTVVGRYKGKVHAWDVVNEAFEDDGSYRKTKFFTIIGKEYIPLAFEFARTADPNAELYYNDYSMYHEGKRKAVIRLIEEMKSAGLRIDAVGMHGHYTLAYPSLNSFAQSIQQLGAAGVQVMVTELDISVIPSPYEMQGAEISTRFSYTPEKDPYTEGIPDSIAKLQTDRYKDFFKVCLQHQDVVSRITVWGVNDLQSWRNDWPIKGRTDYPLLFDRKNQPKPVMEELVRLASQYTVNPG